MLRSLPFLLREALVNLRRHSMMTIASVTGIAIALTLLGGFFLTFQQVDAAAKRTLGAFEMRVFCKQDTSAEAARDVSDRLSRLPGVARATFLSREAAWAEQSKNYPIDTAGLPNLMPHTVVVELSDAGRGPALAQTVRSWPGVDEVLLLEQEIKTLLRIADIGKAAGGVCGVVLLLGAIAIVANTIRLSVHMRRREIRIMQIVGASPWFIRLPLVLEGFLHGVAGGGVATGVLLALCGYVAGLVQSALPQFAGYGAPVDAGAVALALTGGGALLGMLASGLAIRRYLRAV
jgi:Cell division protein